MYEGPAVAFMPQGPEVPLSGPGYGMQVDNVSTVSYVL